MDDPWGSPWASAVEHSMDHDTPSLLPMVTGDNVPKPPPPALTNGVPSLPLSVLAGPSPWADSGEGDGGGFDGLDGNAFGDWTTSPPSATGGNVMTTTAYAEAAASDTSASSFPWISPADPTPDTDSVPDQLLTPLPAALSSFAGQVSPIALPSAAAWRTSRTSRSPAGSVSSKRSPIDPWRTQVEPVVECDQTPQEDILPLGLGPGQDSAALSTPHVVIEERKTRLELPGHSPTSETSEVSGTATASRRSSLGSEDSFDGELNDGDDEDGDHGDAPSKVGRRDGETKQYSPSTTSVDDEAVTHLHARDDNDNNDDDKKLRPRTSPAQRKVSPKVQELVDMFDGLATSDPERQASPSPSPMRGGGKEKSENGNKDENDSFFDFEEAKRDAVVEEDDVVKVTSPATAEPSLQHPVPLSAAYLLDKYGPVEKYTPDQEKIDALFDTEPSQDATTDEETAESRDGFVPNYVLTDSFTSISERKTWYRIVRPGSYRKHRVGNDDENYRPITWATSTAIRGKTVQIVRRWMEEDSLTGRTTLGGVSGGTVFRGSGGWSGGDTDGESVGGGRPGSGIGGGRGVSIFGWDSAAEPVSLEMVYRRNMKPAPPASEERAPLPPLPPSEGHKRSVSVASTASMASLAILPLPVPMLQPQQPRIHALPAPNAALLRGLPQDEEDADEWGEMVSSPTMGAFAAAPVAGVIAPDPGAKSALAAPSMAAPTPAFNLAALADMDTVVENILNRLPDLSYMSN